MADGKKAHSLIHKPNPQDLGIIGSLLEQGTVTPVTNQTYPLEKIPEDMVYLRKGKHHGKVVITVQDV